MRALGAVLLLGGGLWLGMGAAGELSRRVRALESWVAALGALESELAFRAFDLPRLLETVARRARTPVREVLTDAGEDLARLGELSFSELWERALRDHPGGLTGEDLAALGRLGDILGRYGREEQQRLLAGVRDVLEKRLVTARQNRERKGNAYGALGLTLGAFLTILLI